MTDIVKFNLRGTIFQANKSTLTKFDTVLERFASGRGVQVFPDEFGAIQFNRDPKHFNVILNFMRDGNVPLPEPSEDVKEIRNVAKSWVVRELVELCTENLDSQRIKLDVGGQIFHTSVGTLRKMPMFKDIESIDDVPIDKSGNVSFDRDPKHFHRILNFLRDGYVALPVSSEDVKEIQTEAEYYLLNRLVCSCKRYNHREGF